MAFGPRSEFDVVVVGAGSAGCALAGRLTEDPTLRVLLLEAGGSDDVLEVQVPAGLYKTWRTRLRLELHDRAAARARRPEAVLAARQAARRLVVDQRDDLHARRGRRLRRVGASSPATRRWSYEHVLPLFRRMEDNARGADRFHGVGGPLRVEDLRSPHPWTRAVIQSAVAAGYPRNDDFNGATQEGVGQYQVTQKRGRRWSSADAYLHPAEGRPNLTVRTGALTTRVLVEDGRATGVEYRCRRPACTPCAPPARSCSPAARSTPRSC